MHAAVDALLAGLVPADARERAFADEMWVLLAEPGAFQRDHFVPGHFTASAFVLSPDGERLLLIHHRKLGRWLQPGGHFEPGDEGPIQAAFREVQEETGLTALRQVGAGLLDVDVHLIPPHKEQPAHRHFDLRILLRAESEQLAPGDEVAGARWFGLAELSLAFTDESVLRAVRKISAGPRA